MIGWIGDEKVQQYVYASRSEVERGEECEPQCLSLYGVGKISKTIDQTE